MTPRHKGVRIELGGETYIVPPLSLGAIEVYEDRLDAYDTLAPREQRKLILEVAHAALRRNYPDLTVEALTDLIDIGNMLDVLSATMDIAGLQRKAQETGEAGGAAE